MNHKFQRRRAQRHPGVPVHTVTFATEHWFRATTAFSIIQKNQADQDRCCFWCTERNREDNCIHTDILLQSTSRRTMDSNNTMMMMMLDSTTTTTLDGDDDDPYAMLVHNPPLFFLPLWISCTFSLIGSTTIISYIWRTQRHTNNATTSNSNNNNNNNALLYHRIVLGMSIADSIGTLGYATSVFLVPSATHLAWAWGNTTTCQISGMLQIGILSPFLYNAELAVYCWWYHYQTRRQHQGAQQETNNNSTTTTMSRWWWLVHVIPLASALALATLAGPVLQVIHPDTLTGLCDLGPFPPHCSGAHDCANGPAVELLFHVLTILLAAAVVLGIVATWWLVGSLAVQNSSTSTQLLRRLSFSSLPGNTTTTTASTTAAYWDRRKRDMTTQAFLYTLMFSVMILILGYANAWRNVNDWSRTRILWHRCLYHVVAPAQGTFHALIYFRLRIRSWRDHHPTRSWWWAVVAATTATMSTDHRGEGAERRRRLPLSTSSGSATRRRSAEKAAAPAPAATVVVVSTASEPPPPSALLEEGHSTEGPAGSTSGRRRRLPDEADFDPSSCHSDDEMIIAAE